MIVIETLEPRILLHGEGGTGDEHTEDFAPPDAIVLSGDWDGDGDDEAGAYDQVSARKGVFLLDLNDDDVLQANERFVVKGKGITPLAADYDDDGTTEVGWFKKGKFRFDANGDHLVKRNDFTIRIAKKKFTEGAVSDVNNDGRVDLATRRPGGDWQVSVWDNTDYKAFAKALKQAGTRFFGAFWCPHCATQKALFKDGVKKLPYVECSKPNRTQRAVCNKESIASYPTWEFPDGSRLTGPQSVQTLSQRSGVTIPTSSRPYNKIIDLTVATI